MSYQLQQYIAAAIESVLASGQSYVATANIQKNRDSDTSTVPRYEIEVGNVARASAQMVISQDTILVSGAGTSSVNGVYRQVGTINSQPAYYLNGDAGSMVLNWEGDKWAIHVTENDDYLYQGPVSIGNPLRAWSFVYQAGDGVAPAPSVSQLKFYNHFTAEAQVSLVTERGSSTNHAAAVARTRYLFSQEAQSFVSPVVTAFEVLSLEPTAEAQDVNEEAREDWSRLGFRFEIGLLPSAYVVPSAG